jgi:serine/threonine protein kinase
VFTREAALLAALKHPNILSLVGVCTAGDPLMILLQFCEHGSLHEFLREHTGFNELLPVSKMKILHDIAVGMHYLTTRQVVHRDLAARNVLVNADFVCKVGAREQTQYQWPRMVVVALTVPINYYHRSRILACRASST